MHQRAYIQHLERKGARVSSGNISIVYSNLKTSVTFVRLRLYIINITLMALLIVDIFPVTSINGYRVIALLIVDIFIFTLHPALVSPSTPRTTPRRSLFAESPQFFRITHAEPCVFLCYLAGHAVSQGPKILASGHACRKTRKPVFRIIFSGQASDPTVFHPLHLPIG